jgi:cyanophycinase-like exopeptidase
MARKLQELIPKDRDSQSFEYILEYGTSKPFENKPSILLIGGAEGGSAGENAATEWFLKRCNKGNYLVLRSGGVGSQAAWVADYYRDFIQSAAELSIDSRAAANNPEVVQYIKQADALFIAGGDQNKYEDYWQGTATETAINYLINQKKIPVAGTSAGMAILGDYYYAPATQGVISSEILDDPFHPHSHDIYRSDFIQIPFLKSVITDTHLDRQNDVHPDTRYGRIFGLLARIFQDCSYQHPAYAIGLEEGAFIAIDENGIAQVFGNGKEAGQDAYFLQATGAPPERMEPGSPLVWDNNGQAVKVYRIAGKTTGSGSFDLKNWSTASGGEWEYWYTTDGWPGFKRQNKD